MREFIRLVGTLTIISTLAAGALSYTYNITKPTIEANRLQKRLATIQAVLPPFDNKPDQESVRLKNSREEWVEFYVAKKDGQPVGVAFQSAAQGYSSKIAIMIGVVPDGKIHGISILDQNETPGLGNKIQGEGFTRQFQGKNLSSSRWDVKKLNGDFDQVTAATLSSKTVIRGIQEGLAFYQSNVEKILKMN
jgi:electron transport complex protein RnfG